MATLSWQEASGNQKIVAIFMLIVLFVFLGKFTMLPLLDKLESSEHEVSELKIKIENVSINSLDMKEGQLEILIAQEKSLGSLLPKKIDALKLLRTAILNYERYDREIEFVLLEPMKIERGEMSERADGSAIFGPGILPIQLKIIASFAEVVQYFNYLENQYWILSTRSIEMKQNSKDREKLTVDAVITLALNANLAERTIEPNKIVHVDVLDVKKTQFYSLNSIQSRVKKRTSSKRNSARKMRNFVKPTFTVDGIWKDGIIVNGDLYSVDEVVGRTGWKLLVVDLLKNEVMLVKNGNKATIKVKP